MKVSAQMNIGWVFWLLSVGSFAALGGGQLAASGDLRLVEAVKAENKEAVRALLGNQIDVNVAEGDGTTALHWAVYKEDVDTADSLIRLGAHVDAANDYGVTPLRLACENGNASIVAKLLAAGASANAAVNTGETVLMMCARTGSVDGVTMLLDYGADVEAKETSQRQTALMWAAAMRHPDVVRVLLQYGANVQARSRVSREVISRRLQSDLKHAERLKKYGTDAEETAIGGFTPLLFAVREGDVESAGLLLAAGANVNDRMPDGVSALMLATLSEQPAMARFLLDKGADPNVLSAGYAALHAAVMTGDADLVEKLLVHGARPNVAVTQATRVTRNGQQLFLGEHVLGATPFALAAKFTEVGIMQVLAKHGADPLLALKNGWTPLMLAAGGGWKYRTWDRRDRALINNLETQQEILDESGTLEAVKLALTLDGSNINAVDEDGNTALHHVVDKRFNSVVQFLVDHGAKLDTKNNRGQTPLVMLLRGRRGLVDGGDEVVQQDPAIKVTADLLRKLMGEQK